MQNKLREVNNLFMDWTSCHLVLHSDKVHLALLHFEHNPAFRMAICCGDWPSLFALCARMSLTVCYLLMITLSLCGLLSSLAIVMRKSLSGVRWVSLLTLL